MPLILPIFSYGRFGGTGSLNLYKAQTNDSGAIVIGLILLIILIIGFIIVRKKIILIFNLILNIFFFNS